MTLALDDALARAAFKTQGNIYLPVYYERKQKNIQMEEMCGAGAWGGVRSVCALSGHQPPAPPCVHQPGSSPDSMLLGLYEDLCDIGMIGHYLHFIPS